MTQEYVVVGGGIAGLTAAVALAREGKRVTVLEQAQKLGGRGGTETRDGFRLNRGPHALYRNGHAHRTLTAWNIPFTGKSPVVKRDAYLVVENQPHPFPADPVRLFTTSAFRGAEKLAAAGAFRRLTGKLPVPNVTVAQWLDEKLGATGKRPRQLAEAIIRVSTYSNQFDTMSAAAALAQVQFGIKHNVLYLDGGWETIVTGLARHAESLGVRMETGVAVTRVESGCVRAVDREIRCEGAVLAVTPEAVTSLTGVRIAGLTPIRAACLDVAMKSLPPKAAVFALGMDTPFYFSRHSATASLAPAGASLVHVAKYLTTGEHAQREELERFADLAMAGWRDHTVFTRFLPDIAVAHAVCTTAGRPGAGALGMPGVAIAGDWVGDAGMLVDAAVASALRAAESLIAASNRERKAAAA
jgi:glycine/D-amino acid oxidase-like deaminating enzyme